MCYIESCTKDEEIKECIDHNHPAFEKPCQGKFGHISQ